MLLPLRMDSGRAGHAPFFTSDPNGASAWVALTVCQLHYISENSDNTKRKRKVVDKLYVILYNKLTKKNSSGRGRKEGQNTPLEYLYLVTRQADKYPNSSTRRQRCIFIRAEYFFWSLETDWIAAWRNRRSDVYRTSWETGKRIDYSRKIKIRISEADWKPERCRMRNIRSYLIFQIIASIK